MGTDPSGPPLSTSLRLPQALPSPGVQLQPAMASAAPFGSWIFTAGLPSDERPIIHPVIAHSCLDLGLSQVLGNISLTQPHFPCMRASTEVLQIVSSPASFALVMPFSQWDALSSSGAWSRLGLGQREEQGCGSPRGTGKSLLEAVTDCGSRVPRGNGLCHRLSSGRGNSCLVSAVKSAGTGPQSSVGALPDEIWSLGKARM